eukprot:334929_1
MWYLRINSGPPKYMNFEKCEEKEFDYTYCNEKKFKAKGAEEITIYYDGHDMKANDFYQVEMEIILFASKKLGTIDVTSKILTVKMPQFPKTLADNIDKVEVTVRVYRIEPPLAYKSAGDNFEKFLAEINDQWRVHVMNMVKDGMMKNHIDQNKRIGTVPMYEVLKCLHSHTLWHNPRKTCNAKINFRFIR